MLCSTASSHPDSAVPTCSRKSLPRSGRIDSSQRDVGEGEPHPSANDALIELVGRCLWDIFSDNHEVLAADGRVADTGLISRDRRVSRRAPALARVAADARATISSVDRVWFWMARQVDLHPVELRRSFAASARFGLLHWVYHFPELFLIELGPFGMSRRSQLGIRIRATRSPSCRRRNGVRKFSDCARRLRRAMLERGEDAVDRPPPPVVCAYRQVYGRDPRGWPPA